MNIWLVTTGSSDIQLTSKEDWDDWYREIKRSVYRLPFEPLRINDDDERYRLPARVLGTVYSSGIADSMQPYLAFPLLNNFIQKLESQKISLDQIIILTSDQESIFSESEREMKRCPFWQDTCELYPILENYLSNKFPGAVIKPLILKPQPSNLGMDNWDDVLELVQQEINELAFESEPNQVYVSHQAGTPAISSAVQFCSLARFGDRVRFLVSSEQGNQEPNIISSSAYLKGIRKQEAIRLLSRYDYSGIETLLVAYLNDNNRLSTLLKAAIEWNNAQFDHFLEILSDDPWFSEDVEARKNNWWWRAYEEAYLAVIRKDQDNVVEAFFHSFRAFEEIFAKWGKHQLGQYFEFDKRIPYLNSSVLDDPKDYFSNKRCKDVSDLKNLRAKLENSRGKPIEDIGNSDRVELNMATLCKIFRALRYKEYKRDCGELKIFWDNNKENNVSEQRNVVVHQVQGMAKSDLWSFWGVASLEDWKNRLLGFLNFIVKEDFSEGFSTLEEASLMAQVHKELVSAIADV